MQLAYATSFDWEEISNWSGLGVYYAKMLKETGFPDLNCLKTHEKPLLNSAIDFLRYRVLPSILKPVPSPIFNHRQSKNYARYIHRNIGKSTHLLSPNTVILAHVKKDIRKILYTDSTLDNLLNFYSNYFDLPENAVLEAQELEQKVFDEAELLLFTSKWAADSAITRYNAPASKVFTVPFGANLQYIPDDKELKSIVSKRDITKHIHLLLFGVDWDRKGGDYALQVTEKLNQAGIAATLHVAGVQDIPKRLNKAYIVDHGFISKSSKQQELKLCKLIADSDFLILPSQADCTPVVFSEANAFGLPCLASKVGGHTSIIKDNVNGRTWNHHDFVDDCTRYILDLVESKTAYEELCFSSRNVYLNELNWKTVGQKISNLICSI